MLYWCDGRRGIRRCAKYSLCEIQRPSILGLVSSGTKVGGLYEFDDFIQAKFLVGDERSVAARMRSLRDELGIDHVIAWVLWPGRHGGGGKAVAQRDAGSAAAALPQQIRRVGVEPQPDRFPHRVQSRRTRLVETIYYRVSRI